MYPSRVTCCAWLTRMSSAHRRSLRRDRPSRILAGLPIAAALVGLVVCIAAGVFGMP
jgi:hypothetical protein